MSDIHGLHHMTAICGDAQQNVDFYAGTLGLRLVKVTVNFDDPSAYHLYYGDALATPGSLLTFFPYPTSQQGRPGIGQCVVTSLSVPMASLDYWKHRLAGISTPSEYDHAIDFADPDGLCLRIIGDPNYKLTVPWGKSPVPPEYQISGIFSLTLQEQEVERTAGLLMRVLGFDHDGDAEVPEYVFTTPGNQPFRRVDISNIGYGTGRPGRGTVHHIAFRTTDDESQQRVKAALTEVGANVSEVRDRDYFHSIYFREPGGVLFEVATNGPGFATDEPLDQLGTSLQLPKMHEPHREKIEAELPKLNLPE
jgi:glyoxalase family protein